MYRPAGQPSVRSVSARIGRVIEIDARVAQQRCRLVRAQAQIARADLQHAPLRPHPGQRQRRLFPARHHDPRSLGNVVDERGDGIHARRIAQEMQVVEHQYDRARHRRKCRADPGNAGRPDRPAGRRQRLEHRRRNRLDPVQGRRDVAQQDHGIVVALVELRRSRTTAHRRSARCASSVVLPKPAGATTLTARALDARQPVDQLRLDHRVYAQRRRRELGLDQLVRKLGRRHGSSSEAESRCARRLCTGRASGSGAACITRNG